MRAASRVSVGLLVAGLVVMAAPRATAQLSSPAPTCPAIIDGQPLSVEAPFSGVVRPSTDAAGEVVGGDLLCAYGDGARPGAEVRIAWRIGDEVCADVDTAVAEGLDAAAFGSAGEALAEPLGPTCAADPGRSTSALIGGALLGVAVALLGGRAWRRRRWSPSPAASDVVVPEDPVAPLPSAHDVPAPSEPTGAPSEPVRPPDVAPVLAALRSPGGGDLVDSAAGQLAVAAALAYRRGASVPGDLARAALLQVDRSDVPARSDLARWCERVAHELPVRGR